MKKRVLSLLMAFTMLFLLLPTTALAAEGTTITVATKDELDAAISAAEDGNTIQLTEDVDYGANQLKIEKAITLDLGGKTLTTGNNYGGTSLKNGPSIVNGTISHVGRTAAIKAWNVGSFENLTITVAANEPGKVIGGIVIQEGTSVCVGTIKNVTIKGEGLTNGIETYNCGNTTEPVIGSMENVIIDAKGTGMLISAPCGTATDCTINGGVSGIDMLLKGTYSAKLTLVDCDVAGGTQAVYAHDEQKGYTYVGSLCLTADAATTFASDNGVLLTQQTEETSDVTLPAALKEGAVAVVNGTYYKTLAEAVAAANAVEGGATVEVLDDVTLGEKLTISGDVTIEGEYTITRDDDYTGTLFTVEAGAELTLDGGLTIDGGNEWVMDMDAYNADLTTFTKVTDGAKYFTPEEGAPVATAHMITVSGTDAVLNLNKVTIKNHYATSEQVIVSAGTGATVNLTDATITHNAITSGSGLVVNASSGKWDTTPVIWVNMNEGTVIDGNHVGGNHGVFKVYMGTVFTMNGGEIKNTTGWNSNGVAVGIYWATFNMNGGEICSNSSVYGPNNGRNAAVYGHSAHTITMTGGSICHNVGGSRSGLDAPYADSSSNGTTTITGGSIVDNSSYYNDNGIEGYEADITAGDKLTITGGTYTQDVTQWCDRGLTAIYDDDEGVWTIEEDPSQAVASVDGKLFYYVQDAIDAAKAGDTVVLLKNEVITESIEIAADDEITLDLNGNTLQTDATANDETSVSVISNLGKLTITDSVGGGAVIANDCYTDENGAKTKNGFAVSSTDGSTLVINGAKIVGTNWGYALYVVDDTTTVTIEEGSVVEGRGALYLDGGATGTISGGEFAITVQTTNDQDNVVYVGGTSSLTIMDGNFDATKVQGRQRVAVASLGSSTVTIKDGTFKSLSGNIQARAAAGSVKVYDGTFNGTTMDERTTDAIVLTGGTYAYNPTEWVADKYVAIDNGDGTWTVDVAPNEAVAEVNGKKFPSIEDAIRAQESGDTFTVTVLKDHTVDTNSNYALIYSRGRNVTLDLNGNTVTFDYTKKVNVDTVWASIYVSNGGEMTIIDSSTEQTGKLHNKGDNGTARIAWVASGTSLIIENGIFVNEQPDTMFYTSNSNKDVPTTLYIKGGDFTQVANVVGQNDRDCFNQQDGYQKQVIELTGGTYNEDPRNGRQNDWEVTISNGYKVVDNGNGTWSVIRDKQTVQVVIYRNGDTTEPYKSVDLGLDVIKGETLDLTELDINDYYSYYGGFDFEGWYNDGGWNSYVGGNPNNKLGNELTVNGWTNLKCMVWDKEKIIVKAVVDGDKDNAETIFNGTALKGSNLVEFLTRKLADLEKTGYTLDKWFKWDSYGTGYKFSDTDTVNGWTNVYVTYTAKTYTITFQAGEYGTFADGSKTYTVNAVYGDTFPAAPELKADKHFTAIGWEPALPATVPVDGGTYTVVWKQISSDPGTVTPTTTAYKVEHYLEDLNGEYVLKVEDTVFPLYAKVGDQVSATVNEYIGYTVKSADTNVTVEEAKVENGEAIVTTLKVYYDLNEYTVTFDANGGKAVAAQTIKHGGTAAKPAVPSRSGYDFEGWYLDGEEFDFDTIIVEDITLTAKWDRKPVTPVGPTTYKVDIEADGVESSHKTAKKGETVTLTVEEGLEIIVLDEDGDEIELTYENGEYTFEMPSCDVTVEEVEKVVGNPFLDVADDAYYTEAVLWAVENGITTGTGAVTFSPDAACTRAQVVTFLWRAAGSPEPKSTVMPFADVAADAYYYNAVLWAVEVGITDGTSATTFSPDADCTRAQIVTFLWRSQGSEDASAYNPFVDVANDAYYTEAVLWAVENGITNGTGADTFSPDADCTRGQIVTFLYRCLAE